MLPTRLSGDDNGSMSKRHAAAEPDLPPTGAPAAIAPWLKGVLSLLLTLHVLAVFVPPFAFASNVGGSTSPFADGLFTVLRPYIGVMFLDHGYFFFAPTPGPSHLVDYKVEFADGREPVEGRFPNLKTERPRLLYHRYFMMAEWLNNNFEPAEPPPEPSPPPITASKEEKERFDEQKESHARQLALWQHRRRQYESLSEAFKTHLKNEHGGSHVSLTRVEHRPAFPSEVLDQDMPLDDPRTYENLPETLTFPPMRPAPEPLRGALPAPIEHQAG
jgi:hypothetical protein